jgi:ABC-type multidrug transport system permease subunit
MRSVWRIAQKELYELSRAPGLLMIVAALPVLILFFVGGIRAVPLEARVGLAVYLAPDEYLFAESSFYDLDDFAYRLGGPVTDSERPIWAALPDRLRGRLEPGVEAESITQEDAETLRDRIIYLLVGQCNENVPPADANPSELRFCYEEFMNMDAAELYGALQSASPEALHEFAQRVLTDLAQAREFVNIWQKLNPDLQSILIAMEDGEWAPETRQELINALNLLLDSNPPLARDNVEGADIMPESIEDLAARRIQNRKVLNEVLADELVTARPVWPRPSGEDVRMLAVSFDGIEFVPDIEIGNSPLAMIEANGLDVLIVWDGNWHALTLETNPYRLQALKTRVKPLLMSTVFVQENQEILQGTMSAVALEAIERRLTPVPYISRPLIPDVSKVPGFIALITCTVPFVLGSLSLVSERERGTLSLLLASCRGSWTSVLSGKGLFILAITYFETGALVLFSAAWYGFTVHSNVWIISLLSLPAVLAALLFGIAVSAAATSHVQSLLGSSAYLMCTVLFTGFLLPLEQASEAVSKIARIFPLTALLEPVESWTFNGLVNIETAYRTGAASVILAAVAAALLAVLLRRLRRQM